MDRSYQYLLFDLDGTLTDSAEGITNSAAYALEKFGITVPKLYYTKGVPVSRTV